MICRKTMMECSTPSMCAPFQGCTPAPSAVGWTCPTCGKGNAPWQPVCANQLCGVRLDLGATGRAAASEGEQK